MISFTFKKNKSTSFPAAGFTLIELLVAVAIIGILSAIIIPNLGGSKNRAKDGVIKSELKSASLQAEIYKAEHGNYGGLCNDPEFESFWDAASVVSGGAGVCNANANAWAAYVPLKSPPSGTTGWCVDSEGNEKATNVISGGTRVCP